METIVGFICKNCGYKIGQWIRTKPEKDHKKEVECPKCHSTDCEYKMKM